MHVPETSERHESGETGDHAVGGEVQSHDVRTRWRRTEPRLVDMSALLKMCPKDVKEQMMMRLDEIGENIENFKPKVVSYTTNKTNPTRGGPKEMHVPMEVDHVSGSEPQVEDWEDVEEARRESMCYS